LKKQDENEGYRWVILGVVYLSILTFALTFQSIPPILPLIISDLGLTYAQAGLLVSLFALPGLFVSLLGGFFSDRYGMRPLGMGCFLLLIGGTLLVGLGNDLWILWLGRVIAGIGSLTLTILLPKLLSDWFKDKELGLAMGIFNTGVPLGSILCFSFFGKLGGLLGWRVPILMTGIYSAIVSILYFLFYRLPPTGKNESNPPSGMIRALKEMGLPIWGVGLSWLWFNASFVSFTTFAPGLFMENGYTLEQSGLLIGIPLLGSLLFSTPTGYLVDRIRHQEWFIAIGGLVLSILTLSFNRSTAFPLLVALMGVSSAMIPAPTYSLPPSVLKPANVGMGFGVLSTCSSVGLFGAPYLVGKVRDLTGSYFCSFTMISAYALLISVSILLTRRFIKRA
jgi:predicted MFS family arabinose efflux permease